jgi:CDP-4-dehydro-6-deoxyglucose reductase, E3
VHQAVLDDFKDLSGYAVYACGAPVVVEAAHREFTAQRGLMSDSFYSDAFTFVPKA